MVELIFDEVIMAWYNIRLAISRAPATFRGWWKGGCVKLSEKSRKTK